MLFFSLYSIVSFTRALKNLSTSLFVAIIFKNFAILGKTNAKNILTLSKPVGLKALSPNMTNSEFGFLKLLQSIPKAQEPITFMVY